MQQIRREFQPADRPTYRDVLRAYNRLCEDFLSNPRPQLNERLLDELRKPGRFGLGRMVSTLDAGEALQTALHTPSEFLLQPQAR